MHLIELYPYSPKDITLEKQLKKIKEEYEEVLTADSFENKSSELLDLAQTVVGYLNLKEGLQEYNRAIFYDSKINVDVLKKLMEQKDYKMLAWNSLNLFYTLIIKRSVKDNIDIQKSVEEYIDKHYKKLEKKEREKAI